MEKSERINTCPAVGRSLAYVFLVVTAVVTADVCISTA